MTETEIKRAGFLALVNALGNVDAERFIAMVQRDTFDYTKWQRTLWPSTSVEELSNAATQHRQERDPHS